VISGLCLDLQFSEDHCLLLRRLDHVPRRHIHLPRCLSVIFLVLLCLYRVFHVIVREILILALSSIVSVKRRELHVSVMPAAGDYSSVRHGIGHDMDVLPFPFSRAYDINEFQICVEEGSALPESFDEDPGIVPHLSHCFGFFPLSIGQGVRGI